MKFYELKMTHGDSVAQRGFFDSEGEAYNEAYRLADKHLGVITGGGRYDPVIMTLEPRRDLVIMEYRAIPETLELPVKHVGVFKMVRGRPTLEVSYWVVARYTHER